MKHNVKKVVFTVAGSGDFPFDMLRYDRCYPSGEGESYQMSLNDCGERTVQLCAHSIDGDNDGAPTRGRWSSFGWRVL